MKIVESWEKRLSEDMRLHDFRPKTQESYMWATRQLAGWLKGDPGKATEEDLREYFLYLREGKQLAPSTINVAQYGIQFFSRTP